MYRIVFALVLVLIASGFALADEPGDLYRGRTIVTGIKDETRIPAVPICFLDVLAKVSGDARLLRDPRANEVAATAHFTLLNTAFATAMRCARFMMSKARATAPMS